jgi:alkanesulfonate monooxygenase SsuD/methylene tetrahydromethanopterin reductase-like flavin-dependent oxidoreductase (luciferase family)
VYGRIPYAGTVDDRASWPAAGQMFDPQTGQRSVREGLDLLERADQLGFDWVSVAEHHYTPQQLSPNPMVLAGALSQRVKNARIALLGPTLPFLNPVRVAEELALLDNMSNGRVIAGLMRGAPSEYMTYGVNPAESRERFQEALQLILTAWIEPQPFGWEGRFYQFRTVSIWSRPVQQPHPPVFMSGSTPESGEFAARLHLGLGLAFTTVPLAKESARHYREQAAGFGWHPTPNDVLYRTQVSVADTDELARAAVLPYFTTGPRRARGGVGVRDALATSGFFGRDAARHASRELLRPQASFDEAVELGQIVCGSPPTAMAQLRRIQAEVGAGIVDLSFQSGAMPFEVALRSLEYFARDVLPCLHGQ